MEDIERGLRGLLRNPSIVELLQGVIDGSLSAEEHLVDAIFETVRSTQASPPEVTDTSTKESLQVELLLREQQRGKVIYVVAGQHLIQPGDTFSWRYPLKGLGEIST